MAEEGAVMKVDMRGPCLCDGRYEGCTHTYPCGQPNDGTGRGPWCAECQPLRAPERFEAESGLFSGPASFRVSALRKLTPDELRAAHTDLLRLAVLIESIRFEDLAKAILTPDALPDNVEGFEIHGRVCVWCKALDCDQREVHAQLERVGQREA